MATGIVMPPQTTVLPENKLSENKSYDEGGAFNPIDPNKKEEEFRNYQNSKRQKTVEEFYFQNHKNQTLDFVLDLKNKINFNAMKLTIWEAFQYLETVVDNSDPDTNLTQIMHGLQTAEAIRKEYPDQDWLHLTALIHDLGKVLCAPCFNLPQWAIVGDTTPVGCRFSDKNVFAEFFEQNPDFYHPVYTTEYGIYEKNCGLMNLHMTYGHDEYLYQVLKHNTCHLPPEALYIIRFHSFYAWHKYGAYKHLENDVDREMFDWIKLFNRFDLYSKSTELPNLEELKEYYLGLIDKYLPGVLSW
jgi:inositol oxygenase